jgi:hypothetical protein
MAREISLCQVAVLQGKYNVTLVAHSL